MENTFLRLQFGDQFFCAFERQIIANRSRNSPVSNNRFVDRKALRAHGLTASKGGSVKHSQSPMTAKNGRR
jgi:hypothetical protein